MTIENACMSIVQAKTHIHCTKGDLSEIAGNQIIYYSGGILV